MSCQRKSAPTLQFSPSTLTVSTTSFGRLPDGTGASLFHLTSPEIRLTVTNFGARVVSLLTRDRHGEWADLSLGYDDADTYATTRNAYFGATVGRFANRIAGGQFILDGQTYRVPLNNGLNALHGGRQSFDLRLWEASAIPDGVAFHLTSPDGDNGFPGTLHMTAGFSLNANRVGLSYQARTDAPTVLNLTNHTYFNLAGEGAATILDHELLLYADAFTPVSASLIPTGEVRAVAGTPFDFTHGRSIGRCIADESEQLTRAGGYDHNFIVRGERGALRPAAKMHCPATGRTLAVATTEPGVQFYSGNFLNGTLTGRSARPYMTRSAFCLETQHFPDSPNHPMFPDTTLRPGEEFRSETVWTFTSEETGAR